jgi:hypothetical protein
VSVETTALILAWIAIVILACGLAGALLQIQALRVGVPSVGSVGPRVGTRPVSVLPGRPSWPNRTLLLFMDATCEVCGDLVEAIERSGHPDSELELVAVYPGAANGHPSDAMTVLEREAALFEAFRVSVTPLGVIVDENGSVLAAEPVGSLERLDALMSFPRSRGEE